MEKVAEELATQAQQLQHNIAFFKIGDEERSIQQVVVQQKRVVTEPEQKMETGNSESRGVSLDMNDDDGVEQY